MSARRARRDKAETKKVTRRSPAGAHEPAVDEDLEAGLDEAELEEAEDAVGEDEPEDMDADLEAQAADYLAGNDVWMYGPNAEAVMEILDELEETGPTGARFVAEAWLEIPRAERERARRTVRRIYEADAEANRHLQLAREAVATWMAVAAGYPDHVKSEPDWPRLCSQAGEAAMDAATAVILEETLAGDEFDALYSPWSEAMERLDAEAEAARSTGAGAAEAGESESEDEEEEDAEEDDQEFGPNSDAVADFLNRLWLLTPEQVGRLVSAWQNVPRDELKRAHAALAALAEQDAEYRDEVRRAQEKLAPWLNATRISETAGFLGQAGQGESRKMAGPALADAVAALVLGDLLEIEDAEILYRPWFNLIGVPPLPEQAEKADEADEAEATSAQDPQSRPAAKGRSPAGRSHDSVG